MKFTQVPSRGEKRPFRKIEKWLFASSLGFALFLIASFAWWRTQNDDFVTEIPVNALPAINAYDAYLAALSQVAYRSEITQASNGFSVHANLQLPDLPVSPPRDINLDKLSSPPRRLLHREYSMHEKTWLLAQNATALQTLKKAAQLPCITPSQSEIFPDGKKSDVRLLGHLMRFEAHFEMQRSHKDAALQSLLDGWKIAIALTHGANSEDTLRAIAIEAMMRRELQSLMPQLSLAQTRRALRTLNAILPQRDSYRLMLQQEKWSTQRGLLTVFQKPDWQFSIAWEIDSTDTSMAGRAKNLYARSIRRDTVFKNYTQFMDEEIARAAKHYQNHDLEPQNVDIISAYLMNAGFRLRWNYARNQTLSALLMTALALRGYQLERGVLPTQLTALVPRYLQSVPRDPFSDGQTLRYSRKLLRYASGTSSVFVASPPAQHIEYSMWPYTLYSIGGDTRDDGGKPIENATFDPPLRYRLDVDSKGDIVAGINTR